jgi:hypothetical protein
VRGVFAAIVGDGRAERQKMTKVEQRGWIGPEQVPEWAWGVLASPGGGPLRCQDGILWAADQPVGHIDQGILRFNLPGGDPSTEYYRTIGGAHFHERSANLTRRQRSIRPYIMSTCASSRLKIVIYWWSMWEEETVGTLILGCNGASSG